MMARSPCRVVAVRRGAAGLPAAKKKGAGPGQHPSRGLGLTTRTNLVPSFIFAIASVAAKLAVAGSCDHGCPGFAGVCAETRDHYRKGITVGGGPGRQLARPTGHGSGERPVPSESVPELSQRSPRLGAGMSRPTRTERLGWGPSRRDSDGSSGRGTYGTATDWLGRDTGGPRLKTRPAAVTPCRPRRRRNKLEKV